MLLLSLFVGCMSLYYTNSAKPRYNGYPQAEQLSYPPQKSSYPHNGKVYKQYDYTPPTPKIPACAKNSMKSYCLEDNEYPTQTLLEEIYRCYKVFVPLYAEVSEQSTENSVDSLKSLEEETYLCPSKTIYARPLRAENVDGKWKVIVNVEKYYQTTRLEDCRKPGESCPLVPSCYRSTCVQKYIYRRFVTYDNTINDECPFKIHAFRLPASCSCVVGT